ISSLHFLDIVFETFQRSQGSFVDLGTFPADPHLAVTLEGAVQNVSTGNRTYARSLEELSYLRMPDHLLLVDGIQHPLHCRLHIRNRVVDNTVQAHVHAFPLCRRLGCGIRTHVETDHDGVGGSCQGYIRFVDGAVVYMDDLYY